MTNTYDIQAKSAAYQQILEQQLGVKMTSEDEGFYQGNFHGKYKATCSSTVCKKVFQGASRVHKRLLHNEKILSESTSSNQVCEEEAAKMLNSAKAYTHNRSVWRFCVIPL